jgi:hypothetical protein
MPYIILTQSEMREQQIPIPPKPTEQPKTTGVFGELAFFIIIVAIIYWLFPVITPLSRRAGEYLTRRRK